MVPKGMEASNIAGRGHGGGGSGEPLNLRPGFPGTSLDLGIGSDGGRKEFHGAVQIRVVYFQEIQRKLDVHFHPPEHLLLS